MSILKVVLFGKFTAWHNDSPIVGLETRKVQELFSFLLLHRGKAHSREFLSTLLWTESSAAQAKKGIRQTLWQLQSHLEPYGVANQSKIVITDHDWVQIDSRADILLDVAVLDAATARVQGVPGAEMTDEVAEQVRHAVEQYQGDLLESCYHDWCLYERERLQNNYLVLLEKLMSHCEAHNTYEQGIEYGTRILRYDRAREVTHYRLMSLYTRSGNRAAALRQYQRCAEILRKELDCAPSWQTSELFRQIHADQVDERTGTAVAVPTPQRSLPHALIQLKALWLRYTELHGQIQEEIAHIYQLTRDR
jgi:DNA-binding SARP family transcriptional activator